MRSLFLCHPHTGAPHRLAPFGGALVAQLPGGPAVPLGQSVEPVYQQLHPDSSCHDE